MQVLFAYCNEKTEGLKNPENITVRRHTWDLAAFSKANNPLLFQNFAFFLQESLHLTKLICC